jgi:hypothetical protein
VPLRPAARVATQTFLKPYARLAASIADRAAAVTLKRRPHSPPVTALSGTAAARRPEAAGVDPAHDRNGAYAVFRAAFDDAIAVGTINQNIAISIDVTSGVFNRPFDRLSPV